MNMLIWDKNMNFQDRLAILSELMKAKMDLVVRNMSLGFQTGTSSNSLPSNRI